MFAEIAVFLEKGQSHQTDSLPFDHFSETL
jgi:hypothetical protein